MRLFACFLLFLVLFGCNPGKDSAETKITKPDSLISKKEMIRILTDVHLTEAALVFLRNNGKDDKAMSKVYYERLYSKYKISKQRFSENLIYYQEDRESFLKMYEQVVIRLKSMSGKESKVKSSND